jgi:hypothetical protein
MDCQDARDRLSLLVCNGIALTDLALLGAHMKGCAACGREIDRRRRLPSIVVPLRLARQTASGTIAATRARSAGVSGLAMQARSLPGSLHGAGTRLAAGATEAVVTGVSRSLRLAATPLAWARTQGRRASAAGFTLTTALVLSTPGEIAQPPAPAGGLLASPPAEPRLTPPEAVPVVAPPAAPAAAAGTAGLQAGPAPGPAVPGLGPAGPGSAPAVPQPRPGGPSTARPAREEPARPVPMVVEPRAGDVTLPDVIGRLWVANLEAAERDVATLLQRLGGTEVGRRRGPTSTTFDAVVPSSGYAELCRRLAAMGSWLVEAQRSALPDGIRITIRLSQSAPPRPGAGSVP